MSDFNDHMPGKGEVDKVAVIGSNMGWIRPWAGTGLGCPESLQIANAAWADISRTFDEAHVTAQTIDGDEFINDKGKDRDRLVAYKTAQKRFDEIDRRIEVTKGNLNTIAVHLERNGKPTPDVADQRAVGFWNHHQDTSQLELEILYRDLVAGEGPGNPNHQWMAEALEEMVSFSTGKRRLPDDVVAEGRRQRGARKDPMRAAELAGLRGAVHHLTMARNSIDSHVREVFRQPKRDAIAETARGFNGN